MSENKTVEFTVVVKVEYPADAPAPMLLGDVIDDMESTREGYNVTGWHTVNAVQRD